jgi:hypothetical protein
MKNTFYLKISKILAAVFIMFSIYSCSDDDTTPIVPIGPAANTISGTITFVDTNFITSGGFYDIGVFPNPSNPPTYWFGPPSSNDTLRYVKVGNVYQAPYVLKGVSNGSYVVAVGFRKTSGGQSPILGVYGCDTIRAQYSTCFLNPQRITISNDQGVEGVNFKSWADTTNKVF